MKKLLAVIGGIFLVLILVIAGFAGYAVYQGRSLDASSKAYVQKNVPIVISSWSEAALLRRASPQLLKILNKSPEETDLLFKKFSKLGAMQSFGNIKGQSNVLYTTDRGKVTTAAYRATAKFENGEAHISVQLIRLSGHWKFQMFYINSPLFLQ